ncbi:hypothetical protein A3Q56_04099 [Intoshia linei]|uniref:SANT domain-containing protein n=1 Tax=Intoshia linei TaxID=1819745 RepID=A0A177B421_9BILA|nr:hypothetical protein A3Q56_04099 [Intoshia linei]
MENEMNVEDWYYASGSNPNGVSKSDILMRTFGNFKHKRMFERADYAIEEEIDLSIICPMIDNARKCRIEREISNSTDLHIYVSALPEVNYKVVWDDSLPHKESDKINFISLRKRNYLDWYQYVIYQAISTRRNMTVDAVLRRYLVPLHNHQAYHILEKWNNDYCVAMHQSKCSIKENLSKVIGSDMKWNQKEVFKFETAVYEFGKNYCLIQRAIPTRSVQEVANFYLNWNATDLTANLNCFSRNKSLSDIVGSSLRKLFQFKISNQI